MSFEEENDFIDDSLESMDGVDDGLHCSKCKKQFKNRDLVIVRNKFECITCVGIHESERCVGCNHTNHKNCHGDCPCNDGVRGGQRIDT